MRGEAYSYPLTQLQVTYTPHSSLLNPSLSFPASIIKSYHQHK